MIKSCGRLNDKDLALREAIEIIEHLDSGILKFDSRFRLTYLNAVAAKFLRRTGKKLIGQAFHDVVPGIIGRESSEEIVKGFAESSRMKFEGFFLSPADIWLQCRCAPLSEGIVLTFRAARADKPDEKALTEKKRREALNAVIDEIPVMLAIFDSTGRASVVNREFERLTGWSREEAASMDLLAACCPDAACRKLARRLLKKPSKGWADFDIVTRSGRTLFASWSCVMFSSCLSAVVGVDISFRKEMEQERLRLASAIEQTGEGVILFSPEWTFEYVNTTYEKISGYSRDELLGKPIDFIKDYFMGEFSPSRLCRRLKEEGRWTGRQMRKRKDGEIIHVELSFSPVVDRFGKAANYIAMVRDITKEHKLQQNLHQIQKMESLCTLSRGVAHDLKNILMPIILNTELALEGLGPDSTARPFLEDTIAAAGLGTDLVKQIVFFGKHSSIRKTAVHVPSLIKEILTFLRSSLPNTIDINCRLNDDCAVAFSDPIQIKQVLINLVTNASHAMKEQGGLLEVCLDGIGVDEHAARTNFLDITPGPYIRITVRDTGLGMSEETLTCIFDPFFTTKRRGEGTGMGLSVVHGILNELSGAITVHSSPGEGSTFTVLLPRLFGSIEHPSPCSNRPKGKGQVLVIDNEKTALEDKRQTLDRLGYRVTAAGDPKEALGLFRYCSTDYDLVITNESGSSLSGLSLVQEVLSIRPDIPVIMCGASTDSAEEIQARAFGVHECLSAPFPMKDWTKGVRRILDEIRPASP